MDRNLTSRDLADSCLIFQIKWFQPLQCDSQGFILSYIISVCHHRLLVLLLMSVYGLDLI